MGELVYVNGSFVPYEEAVIHIEDRGNVFGDGVYEVIRYYGGKPFEMASHLQRLQSSAKHIQLTLPKTEDELATIANELVQKNKLHDATVYLQVSRGVNIRQHAFPSVCEPTLFMIARPVRFDETLQQDGVSCISVEDRRWQMCHVKSIALLANVLAHQEAKAAGAYEGILVRDGIVTEATRANLFAVKDNRLLTHPEGPYILSGITRKVVLQLAQRLGIETVEEPFTLSELKGASEIFLTGTTIEVLPVVEVDGKTIGKGTPGPITTDVLAAFHQRTTRCAASVTERAE